MPASAPRHPIATRFVETSMPPEADRVTVRQALLMQLPCSGCK
jgi:hypothetical protein